MSHGEHLMVDSLILSEVFVMLKVCRNIQKWQTCVVDGLSRLVFVGNEKLLKAVAPFGAGRCWRRSSSAARRSAWTTRSRKWPSSRLGRFWWGWCWANGLTEEKEAVGCRCWSRFSGWQLVFFESFAVQWMKVFRSSTCGNQEGEMSRYKWQWPELAQGWEVEEWLLDPRDV